MREFCPGTVRNLMALAHGWLGLVSGVFVFLIAVTGVALAFFGELFELQYGDMLRAADAPPADIGAIIAAAEAGHPAGLEPLGVLMPDTRVEGLETALVYGRAPDGSSGVMFASVDPGTAAYKGSFDLDGALAHEVNDFHYSLLLGDAMQTFLAAVGFLLIVFALSGLYLWWPRRGRVWNKATRAQRRGRLPGLLLNWHGLAGFWLGLLAVFFALTGTALSKPDWYGPALAAIHDPPEWEARFKTDCGDTVTPAAAARLALGAFPDRHVATLVIVDDLETKYVFRLRGPDDLDRRFGDAIAHVHARCRDTIWTTTLAAQSIPAAISGQLLSLHGAHVFGPFAEIVALAAGLGLALLSASGIYLFFKRTLPLQRRVFRRTGA